MEDSSTGPRRRRFFRLVKDDPPTLGDFMTYAALGKSPPRSRRADPGFMRRWSGLSVYDTYRAARELAAARDFQRWRYVAVLEIPSDAHIDFEGPETRGHWNLYGADPAYLRDVCLIRLVHAESTEDLATERSDPPVDAL